MSPAGSKGRKPAFDNFSIGGDQTTGRFPPIAPSKGKKNNQMNLSVSDERDESVPPPQLVCTERELSVSIEDEIKAGFFELKQKFAESGPSSIYISHIILHQKHPIFKKCEIETLK